MICLFEPLNIVFFHWPVTCVREAVYDHKKSYMCSVPLDIVKLSEKLMG